MTEDRIVQERFFLIENDPNFPNDGDTCWYYDTERPDAGGVPFIAVQCECEKNPNQYVRHKDMRLLFTDPCEYYAVCNDCYHVYARQQWSGSTRGHSNWRERANKFLEEHEVERGWCEFCDPVFGNGGWLP